MLFRSAGSRTVGFGVIYGYFTSDKVSHFAIIENADIIDPTSNKKIGNIYFDLYDIHIDNPSQLETLQINARLTCNGQGVSIPVHVGATLENGVLHIHHLPL